MHTVHTCVFAICVAEMKPCLLPRASLCNLFGVHVSKLLKSACELLTLHVPVGVAEKAKHSNFFSMACQIRQICQIASSDCKPEVERLPVMALTGVRQKCCSPMENCSVFRSHFFIQECPPTNLIFYWICPPECKGFNLSLPEPNASWVSGPVYGVCMECSHAFGHSD